MITFYHQHNFLNLKRPHKDHFHDTNKCTPVNSWLFWLSSQQKKEKTKEYSLLQKMKLQVKP